MHRGLLIGTLALLLVACGSGTVTPPGSQQPPGATYGANLILNPGAEDGGAVTDDSTRPFPLPHWTTVGTPSPTGVMDAESYAGTGDLAVDSPGPSDRGNNYFSGAYADAVATATQSIDLSARASSIDAGGVGFDLSGWLGGFSSQDDNATLSVSFQNASGTALQADATIGPVLAADRQDVSGLLRREVFGKVPAGTRQAVVTLTMTRTDGTYNDGYADNLSLSLTQ